MTSHHFDIIETDLCRTLIYFKKFRTAKSLLRVTRLHISTFNTGNAKNEKALTISHFSWR